MANTTSVNNALDNIEDQLKWITDELNGDCDKNTLESYIDDVSDAISKAKSEFDDFANEVADIEDDFEGYIKRLSEVCK